MNIQLKKFGTTLVSRSLGKESYNAFKVSLSDVKSNEKVVIDFDGVITFSPSWGDEFLTPLFQEFGSSLQLKSTDNPSVLATLKILEEVHEMTYIRC